MQDDAQRYDFDRVFRLLLTVGLLAGVVWLLGYLSDVLVPFALAVLLAYLLNPIVNAFESKTGRRGVAVGLTLAIFAVVIAVVVPLLVSLVYHEVADVSRVFADRNVKEKILQELEPLTERIPHEEFRRQLQEFRDSKDPEQLMQMALEAAEVLMPTIQKWTQDAFGVVGSIFNAVLACTVLLVVLLYLIFLLMDFNALQASWKDHLPPRYRDAIVELLSEFSLAMSRYFRGQFLVAACCGVLFALGFWLVGLRLAIFLGLTIGLLNMVPYLQVLGFVPALLLAGLRAFEAETSLLWPVLGVLGVFVVVQLIQDALLVPKIMGQATGLKPWVILLSICVWGKLLGLLGLVLAIPLSCLGLAYYRKFILKTRDPQAAP